MDFAQIKTDFSSFRKKLHQEPSSSLLKRKSTKPKDGTHIEKTLN